MRHDAHYGGVKSYNSLNAIFGEPNKENDKYLGMPQISLGWIKRVGDDYGNDRIVDVVTADDRRFINCTVIDPFGNSDGSGLESAPLIDSICLVAIADGYRAFVIGFVKGVNLKTGRVGLDNEDFPIVPGDYRMRTPGGNYIHLHSGSAIDITCNPQCKTLYIPKDYLISHMCKNWSLSTDAGIERWSIINKETGEALYEKQVFRENAKGRFPVFNQSIGKVDKLGTVLNNNFGDGLDNIGKGDLSIYEDGTVTLAFKNGAFIQWQNTEHQLDIKIHGGHMQWKENGTFNLVLGSTAVKANIVYDADKDELAVTHAGGTQQIKMDSNGTVITDGKNGNSITFKNKAIVFQSDSFVFNGKTMVMNTSKVFAGKSGCKGAGFGVITGFPGGTHPIDYWTGIPIKGLSIFGAG